MRPPTLSGPGVGVARAWSSVSPWAVRRMTYRCWEMYARRPSRSSATGATCPGMPALLFVVGVPGADRILRAETGRLMASLCAKLDPMRADRLVACLLVLQ